MEPRRAEQAPVSDFARLFRLGLERAYLDKNMYELDRKIDMALDKIFQYPKEVGPLYAEMASSPVAEVRELAAFGIRTAYEHDPKTGAVTWNRLLNDPDESVAIGAYFSLDRYISDMEQGRAKHRDLSAIYGHAA